MVHCSPFMIRRTAVTLLGFLGAAVLSPQADARPLPRQASSSFTTLSAAEIAAFKPFSFYAAAAYCQPSTILASSCGGESPISVGSGVDL
jgi:hypothetical protein